MKIVNRKLRLCGCILQLAILGAAQTLPEPLMPYDNHNSVCYGPGTHSQQFRPMCPDNTTVIAVQRVRVGAKLLEKGCPSTVTELTNHNGTFLVDHMDTSKLVNKSECCFPDTEQDCIFDYHYFDSGIEYKYHISTSGYPASQTNLEVAWQKTNCNDSSKYLTGTNYMYMEYSCIERTKIGEFCSNHTYTVTDGVFYLYNTGYPGNISAAVDFCQCRIQSDSPTLSYYSIDMRLEKYDNNCEQTFNITDSKGSITLDCLSSPFFNVTRETKYDDLTLTFKNNMPIDGGHVWICLSGEPFGSLKIDCTYITEKNEVPSASSTKWTTVGNTGLPTSSSPYISYKSSQSLTSSTAPTNTVMNSTDSQSSDHVSTATSPSHHVSTVTTSSDHLSTATISSDHVSTATRKSDHVSTTTTSDSQHSREQTLPSQISIQEKYIVQDSLLTVLVIAFCGGILLVLVIQIPLIGCCMLHMIRKFGNKIRPVENQLINVEQGNAEGKCEGNAGGNRQENPEGNRKGNAESNHEVKSPSSSFASVRSSNSNTTTNEIENKNRGEKATVTSSSESKNIYIRSKERDSAENTFSKTEFGTHENIDIRSKERDSDSDDERRSRKRKKKKSRRKTREENEEQMDMKVHSSENMNTFAFTEFCTNENRNVRSEERDVHSDDERNTFADTEFCTNENRNVRSEERDIHSDDKRRSRKRKKKKKSRRKTCEK